MTDSTLSLMSSSIERQLVVFDFDWSLADQDSDRWIFEVLAPDLRRKMKTLESEVQWTDLMTQLLQELHDRNVTREDIELALQIMPFHPAMTRLISKLKLSSSPNTTLFCLSNANSVYIKTILESHNIAIFDEIVTNPAEWDPSGLLTIRRRVDPNGPPHSCKLGCGPNMCKGEELSAFLRRNPTYDRMIYVGDGSNDFCPALLLRSQDMLLCRRYRGLEKRIARDGEKEGMCCKVVYWSGAWEVEEIFGKL